MSNDDEFITHEQLVHQFRKLIDPLTSRSDLMDQRVSLQQSVMKRHRELLSLRFEGVLREIDQLRIRLELIEETIGRTCCSAVSPP